jgi:hypothetical protein
LDSANALIATLLDVSKQHEGTFGLVTAQWFRGQTDASWGLVPGALRAEFVTAAVDRMSRLGPGYPTGGEAAGRIAEQQLNERFQRQATMHLKNPTDLADVYFTAQHYGLPTRLLDWTTNPLVALFFAAQPPDGLDGAVHVLVPRDSYYYQLFGADGSHVVRTSQTPVKDTHEAFAGQLQYLFVDFRGAPVIPVGEPDENLLNIQKANPVFRLFPRQLGGVLPVVPTLRFDRMAAQQSCFTFHPPDCEDITSRTGSVRVLAADKAEVRITLRRMGVTHSALFPGPGGVATELVELLRERDSSISDSDAEPLAASDGTGGR